MIVIIGKIRQQYYLYRQETQLCLMIQFRKNILNALVNQNMLHFGNFKDFSIKILEISNTSSHLLKKKIFDDYFIPKTQSQQKQIIKILNFTEEKPKTGIAVKSICTYLISNFGLFDHKLTDIEKIAQEVGEQVEGFKNDGEENQVRAALEESPQYQNQNQIQFENLLQLLEKLCTIEGKKSKQIKLNLILNFINAASSKQEVIVFLRIVTKNLRMGAKDKLIKFNQSNGQAVSKFDPMLAKPLKNLEDLEKFCLKKQSRLIADVKYDGQRSLIIYQRGHPLEMISRRKKVQTQIYRPFADLLQEQLDQHHEIESIKIDGEIVCVGPYLEPLPMQNLLSQRGKSELLNDGDRMMVFYAFDVLQYNGESFLETPLKQRRLKIPKTLTILPSQMKQFQYPSQKEKMLEFFMEIINRKYEGIIIKGENDFYYTNQSRIHWGKLKKGCKLKDQDTQQIDLDLVLMAVEYGQGKRSDVFGSFLMGIYHEGEYYAISKVGSGFTEEQMEKMNQILSKKKLQTMPSNYIIPKNSKPHFFVKPELVFQVNCQEITRSSVYQFNFKPDHGGLSLRFPVFSRIRDDKSAQQCKGDVLIDLADQYE